MNSVAQLTDDIPVHAARLVALVKEWESDHEGYAAPLSHLGHELHMPKSLIVDLVDELALTGAVHWTEKRGFGERDVASGPVDIGSLPALCAGCQSCEFRGDHYLGGRDVPS